MLEKQDLRRLRTNADGTCSAVDAGMARQMRDEVESFIASSSNKKTYANANKTPAYRINLEDQYSSSRIPTRRLIFLPSEQCNMRCTYCVYRDGQYLNYRKHRDSFLRPETAIQVIDKQMAVKRSKGIIISFFGGEPLLRYETIFRTVDYYKRKYK